MDPDQLASFKISIQFISGFMLIFKELMHGQHGIIKERAELLGLS